MRVHVSYLNRNETKVTVQMSVDHYAREFKQKAIKVSKMTDGRAQYNVPTGTSLLGPKKIVLGKMETVPLPGTLFGPKNSPLRHAVLGGKNLILGPD